MGRTGIIVTGIIAIVLVVGGFIAFGNKKNNNSTTSTKSSPAQSTSNDTGTLAKNTASAAATITYNGTSFSPSQVTVKKNDTVIVKNDSNTATDFESNPHPIHTDEPELNIGIIDPGLTKSFKVTKTGSWGYHNHLNPSQTGAVIVQ